MPLKRLLFAVALFPLLLVRCGSENQAIDLPIHSEWIVQEITGFEGVVSDESRPVLRLVMTHASGNSACNEYRGYFSLSGQNISFTELVSTRKMCAPAFMEVEMAYLDALRKIDSWEIESQQLLLSSEGKVLLKYDFSKEIDDKEEY